MLKILIKNAVMPQGWVLEYPLYWTILKLLAINKQNYLLNNKQNDAIVIWKLLKLKRLG